MADKSEFVDMISEATRQAAASLVRRAVEPVVKETSRLSHWPPDRWRMAHRNADCRGRCGTGNSRMGPRLEFRF